METDTSATLDRAIVLARVLGWQRAMGVDAAVIDSTIDWLSRGETVPGTGFTLAAPVVDRPGASRPQLAGRPAAEPTPKPAPARPLPAMATPKPSQPLARPVLDRTGTGQRALQPVLAQGARPISTAATLEALRAEVERFDGCGLRTTAKSLCFYRGAPTARVMIIGEAPGREEDLAGKPFVGRAGQLLDRMLAAIDLGEADVHITNTVYWRPPGNRQPTPQEMLACRPFLERQIDLVAPLFVVLMGGIAASHMLDTTTGITRLRGKWTTLDRPPGPLKVLPTLHPAYLLRSPAAKRQAWQDLRLIKAALEEA